MPNPGSKPCRVTMGDSWQGVSDTHLDAERRANGIDMSCTPFSVDRKYPLSDWQCLLPVDKNLISNLRLTWCVVIFT